MSGPSVVELPVGTYLTALASTASVPGGGSAAAVAGAMGSALVGMVARISTRKASSGSDRNALEAIATRADELVNRMGRLSQDDIDAFRSVLAARKQAPSEQQRAYRRAAEVPLETAQCAGEGLDLATRLRPLAWSMTASDLEAARNLLQAALRSALANVAANLPELAAPDRSRIQPEYERLRRVTE